MKWYWWVAIAIVAGALLWYYHNQQVELDLINTKADELLKNMQTAENKNLKAFLAAIRYAEGTAGTNGYRTLYGGSLFNNMLDHPYLTKEWNGAKLPDAYCKGAGLGPGCKTTAAGAYQLTQATWKRLKQRLSLPDFSVASQDKAAIALLVENKSMDDIEAGRFAVAIGKNAKTWASLPGYNEGQPEKKLTELVSVYAQYGGLVA